jgi:hypothetical protein
MNTPEQGTHLRVSSKHTANAVNLKTPSGQKENLLFLLHHLLFLLLSLTVIPVEETKSLLDLLSTSSCLELLLMFLL